MPIEHPTPTVATVKLLYAHAFRCAYEGCRRTLYVVDQETGARTLNSRVCHINARREGGPRWDPDQSAKQNRSACNLVLMCLEHASKIDDPITVSAYRAERLRDWKAKQLAEYDQLKQGWVIDTDMAHQASTVSFQNVENAFSGSTIKLGGEGGKAPGAGGGGGGAIGTGARAGHGGPGGVGRTAASDLAQASLQDISIPQLMTPSFEQGDLDAHFPGAGGGWCWRYRRLCERRRWRGWRGDSLGTC